VSFYVSTATFFLLHCDEWDRVVALPRHKFVTGATFLQLVDDVYRMHVHIQIVQFGSALSWSFEVWHHSQFLPDRHVLMQTPLRRISTMYVRGYLQGSENGRVVTIDWGREADSPEVCRLVSSERIIFGSGYENCPEFALIHACPEGIESGVTLRMINSVPNQIVRSVHVHAYGTHHQLAAKMDLTRTRIISNSYNEMFEA
jgi:hypothetical protein